MNERNGQILGYYIRYGQLGSETLSKKTIRDTENLQVCLFILSYITQCFAPFSDDNIWACPVLKLIIYSKSQILRTVILYSSDNNIWAGAILKLIIFYN